MLRILSIGSFTFIGMCILLLKLVGKGRVETLHRMFVKCDATEIFHWSLLIKLPETRSHDEFPLTHLVGQIAVSTGYICLATHH